MQTRCLKLEVPSKAEQEIHSFTQACVEASACAWCVATIRSIVHSGLVQDMGHTNIVDPVVIEDDGW